MAGHSKWANIKHRKGKADAIKGKAFSRATKEIITAVKLGGPDPKTNTRLRLAIQKAREVNMPNDNIERNIKKASSSDQEAYSQITYEIYGYGGVGLILEIMTDNKNRTASDIRIALNKRGGTQANPGSVAFNFDHKGVIQVPKQAIKEDDLFMLASEAGADDFEGADEFYMITTPPEALFQVKEAIEKQGVKIELAELQHIPKNWIECSPEDQKANLELIEWLEGLDDVDAVYHNMNIP